MIKLRSFLLCLSLSLCMVSWSQTTQWRDIYKAKKKDTVFGIAKKYNISMVELMDANPEMKKEGYELKKGDMVFIPYEKTEEQKAEEAKKAAEAERLKLYGANDVRNRAIRIGVMLPLHNIDGDGRRMVEYYRGLLMACEALKAEGLSTDIHAWNVPIDADIRQTLLEKDADNCDIIFGPLYTKQTNALSDFCRTYNIKMVIPFSIQGDAVLTNPNVFQVCTLIDQKSVFTCRQKIGRGLRLCVDQEGKRIEDPNINILHVMATESFADFADKLQHGRFYIRHFITKYTII